MVELIFLLALATLLFSGIAIVSVPRVLRVSPESERLQQVVSRAQLQHGTATRKKQFEAGLSNLVAIFHRRFGLRASRKSRDDLSSAGYRGTSAEDTYLAVQCLSPLVGIFAASFVDNNVIFFALVFGAVGYLAPGIWLQSRVRRRRDLIRRGLPDAMDLLVICMDAGLGLDQSFLRVGEELAISHREIQEEFSRMQMEQRAGVQRMDAWRRLSERVQVPELSMLVSMLVQTERFGTPISQAMSNFASELRARRRQRAEEAAAKTKVKIVFPLVLFIFPCLFLVLLAPALLDMAKVFSEVGK